MSPVMLSLGYLRRSLRASLAPLAHAEIRQLLAPMAFSVLSVVTGGGKSFAVRAAAAAEGRRYLHVPIHSAAHAPLLARLRLGLSKPSSSVVVSVGLHPNEPGTHVLAPVLAEERWLVHLDLSTGVQPSMDKWLFELVVLNLAVDPEEGHTLVLEAPRVLFALELPGSCTSMALQLPSLLPVRWVGPSANTFCSSPDALWAGLGSSELAHERAAQLRRVCAALAEVRASGVESGIGEFKNDPSDRTAAAAVIAARAGELTSPECFHMLLVALDD